MLKIEQRPRNGYFTSLGVARYPIPKDPCGFRRTIPREVFPCGGCIFEMTEDHTDV